jgi:hypothetical protein
VVEDRCVLHRVKPPKRNRASVLVDAAPENDRGR